MDERRRAGIGKLIWHTMMSLDGFIAGHDDAMDWAFEHSGRSPLADAAREATGAILAGRRWYDVASANYDGVAGIYGGRWTGPVFVLTHRPADAPDDPAVEFISTDIVDAVGRAQAAADGHGVGIFGASIARQCLTADLLDEIIVHVVPVLLGGGVRLYEGGDTERVPLERVEIGDSEQVVDLRFRVPAAGAAGAVGGREREARR